MIVREKMARNEDNNKDDKKNAKKGEDNITKNWNKQETLKTRALDRSYKEVLSVSPLKHRVNLEVSPERIDTR